MKKKASLWISGITTVAMLAVAVGSFAAWDSVSGGAQTLSATSSNPVELKVSSDETSKDSKKLVPSGALVKGTDDSEKVSVGTIKLELTDKDTKNPKVSYAAKVSVDGADVTGDNAFKVTLVDADNAVYNAGDDLKLKNATSSGTTTDYTVYVEYAEGQNESAVNTYAGKTISVEITGKLTSATPVV